jgi:hypothetical protein
MKKLRLDADALMVQTFDTVATSSTEMGTVLGHGNTNRFPFCFTQQGTTCEPGYTCPECAWSLDPCPETERTCP